MSTLRKLWAAAALLMLTAFGPHGHAFASPTQLESFETREACENAVTAGVAKPYVPRKTVTEKRGFTERKLGDIYDGKFAAGTCHNGGDTVHGKRFVFYSPDFPIAWKRGEDPLMWKCMNDLDLENAVPIAARAAPPAQPAPQTGSCPNGNCNLATTSQAAYTHTQTILVDAQVKYVCKATGQEVRSPADCVVEAPIEPPTVRLREVKQTCCNIVSPTGTRCAQDSAGCCRLTWTVYKN
jgi:hypothetical protein